MDSTSDRATIFRESYTRSPLEEFESLYYKRLRILRSFGEEDKVRMLEEAYQVARAHLARAVGEES